jgi:hypothetical protein
MQFELMVVRAFGAYAKGDVVSAAEAISAILAGENAAHVVRIAVMREG